ncbi:MAG: NADH-quinone oxidoreductase subunit J [Anaerolineae bacterium]|nr:NADH-quinone oxidoreductase subunit J [Anaerolineae bacterium]
MPALDGVDLIDPVSVFDDTDDETLIAEARFGEAVETLLLDPVRATNLVVRESNPDDPDEVVEYRQIGLAANTNNLLIVAAEELTDGSRIVPMQIVTPTEPQFGSPQDVAGVLFSDYLLPFELVSVLLLVAMVGAIVLTRDELLREHVARRVVRHPLVGPQAAVGLTGRAAATVKTEEEPVPAGSEGD